jgi:hypothetical protein
MAIRLKYYFMQYYPEKIALSVKSAKLLRRLFRENPRLGKIIHGSESEE